MNVPMNASMSTLVANVWGWGNVRAKSAPYAAIPLRLVVGYGFLAHGRRPPRGVRTPPPAMRSRSRRCRGTRRYLGRPAARDMPLPSSRDSACESPCRSLHRSDESAHDPTVESTTEALRCARERRKHEIGSCRPTRELDPSARAPRSTRCREDRIRIRAVRTVPFRR